MSAPPAANPPPPDLPDIAYGPQARQAMDVWLAPGSRPAPAVLYVHGGGWLVNDKARIELPGGVAALRERGIAVISINYRYLAQTILAEGVPAPVITAALVAAGEPPVAVPLGDAARALQTVRHRAQEWNLDARRIAVAGASAGACTALWLAFHPDRARPAAADPVERESTRPCAVAALEAQTTLDPQQMAAWTPNSRYGGHAFGFAWDPADHGAEFASFLRQRGTVLPWIERYSPYALAAAGAPPVFLGYGMDAPAYGTPRQDPTHTANFGALLKEKLDRCGVPCELAYPGAPGLRHADALSFLVDRLVGGGAG